MSLAVSQTSRARTLLRQLLGYLLGWLVAAWLRSLRLVVIDEAEMLAEETIYTITMDRRSKRPWVLVFFHGTQVPLLAWRRRRRTAVLVSLSRDGDLQAQVMARAKMHVVRGSSSRGGIRGLASIVRAVRAARSSGEGLDVAFAVDGPRGPYGTVHGGAASCARSVDGLLVPMGSAVAQQWVSKRAWDRFSVPYPFTRAVVVIGKALSSAATGEEIAAAIAAANDRARAVLEGDRRTDPTMRDEPSIATPRSE